MKTKIQFPHKVFIKENSEILVEHPVPEMLHKRIIGFAELEQDLEQTSEEDRAQLLAKLETLSHELDEDLEEYYEEFLENNELENQADAGQSEETISSITAPSTAPPETIVEKTPEADENKVEEVLTDKSVEKMEFVPGVRTDIAPTDEQILEQFLLAGEQQVLPSDLVAKGFKTPFNGRKIGVGKFLLQKKRYDARYRILLQL